MNLESRSPKRPSPCAEQRELDASTFKGPPLATMLALPGRCLLAGLLKALNPLVCENFVVFQSHLNHLVQCGASQSDPKFEPIPPRALRIPESAEVRQPNNAMNVVNAGVMPALRSTGES